MNSEDCVLAVDLGATNVRTAIILRDGTILGYHRDEVRNADILQRTISLVKKTQMECGMQPKALGISTAGPVDLERGTVIHSPNMQCSEIPLRSTLEKTFGIPTVMATDCKAGALGEYHFGFRREHMVYMTFSTGIGAGVISAGRLLQGCNGNAGEVGHLTVDTEYGIRCGCGGYGHWEAYASGTGIPKFFSTWKLRHRIENYPLTTSEEILSCASKKDPVCLAFAEDVKAINNRGLSSVICAYNPEMIVLDGPLARNYASLLFGMPETYLTTPDIRVTELEGNAPLLGAGVLAFELIG